MIYDGEKNMDWKNLQQKSQPTNNCGLLNDQIWTLLSKVPILVIFC